MSAEELPEIDGLDPAQAIDQDEYEDPTPDEITNPDHPDYCEPAEGIAPVDEEDEDDGDE